MSLVGYLREQPDERGIFRCVLDPPPDPTGWQEIHSDDVIRGGPSATSIDLYPPICVECGDDLRSTPRAPRPRR